MHSHIVVTIFIVIAGQRGSSNARTAAPGLIFHATLIGAHDDLVFAFLLNEIYIDAFFGEAVAVADFSALFKNVEPFHITHHFYIVRGTSVQNIVAMIVFDLMY